MRFQEFWVIRFAETIPEARSATVASGHQDYHRQVVEGVIAEVARLPVR
jgi:hypothetical protein